MRRVTHQSAITATIVRQSHDGRGIALINGKTTFIQGALPGERVEFEYTKKRAAFDEGRTLTLLTASPLRVTPRCLHVDHCGGCHLQHLAPLAQLEHKQKVLLEFLAHQANITPSILLPPLQSPPFGYRRKARLSVKFVAKKNKVVIGFHEKNGRFVADITDCSILSASIGQLLPAFSELFYTLTIRDKIPQMEIAITDTANAIIIRHIAPLSSSDRETLRAFVTQHKLKCYLQSGGEETVILDWPPGDATISYQLPAFNLTLRFLPQQFVQINDGVNQRMVMQAITLMEPNVDDQVLDLFCGIGNFSLPLAKYAKQVVGVEGNALAVTQAKMNATENGLSNTEFFCDDLNQIEQTSAWAQRSFNKILLDPPRTGAKNLMPWIATTEATRVLYISCNPATLARDARSLTEYGYTLHTLGAIDMFPHTQHIEAMALFVR